ncbi:MAG: glycosyl transferase [Chitinophagia bacterium]|jgi:uncharacterized protein (TIGR00661 family)|nr:glycosyl transferase [Chitinophagia bacterium]NCA30753.1 glycosyl transferase [Chitinophagia bacterium]NDD16575.1 glycosyl transferase [Chitinophagia bacterium]
MKIFYAIQGTGNGHISRAEQLYPYLQKHGEVDFFLSGSNAQLQSPLPIKYKSNGISLHYKNTGGMDYGKISKSLSFNIYKEAKTLPIENYDVIINDFEFITSLACSLKKKKSIQFGHQASFQSKLTPRANTFNPLGNWVLNKFVKSTDYLGLHFESYDKNIFNPIIKDEIINATPIDNGHITVYLPQYSIAFLSPYLLTQSKFNFEVFTKEVTQVKKYKNLTLLPIDNKTFTNSLIQCHGIITAGGFETPAEALYLKKKLLSIPILNHFEQECNGAAMQKLGVTVIKKIDKKFNQIFTKWVQVENKIQFTLTHSTEEIVNLLMHQVPFNQVA